MTNFQKLKNGITVEQMAMFMAKTGCPKAIRSEDMVCGNKRYANACAVCWALWLKKEAEEDDTDPSR